MKALYKPTGATVELVPSQQFSDHWNYYEEVQGVKLIKSGIPEQFEAIAPEVIELPAPATISTKLSINKATISEIQKAFPGLGKFQAKRLVERRPSDGYESIDVVRSLNADLNLEEQTWNQIRDSIEF